MSLVSNRETIETDERGEMVDIKELNAQKAFEQRKRRAQQKGAWMVNKGLIDSHEKADNIEALLGTFNPNEPRHGLHSMTVNADEMVIIKAAMKKLGYTSSRQMYIDYCKSQLKN